VTLEATLAFLAAVPLDPGVGSERPGVLREVDRELLLEGHRVRLAVAVATTQLRDLGDEDGVGVGLFVGPVQEPVVVLGDDALLAIFELVGALAVTLPEDEGEPPTGFLGVTVEGDLIALVRRIRADL